MKGTTFLEWLDWEQLHCYGMIGNNSLLWLEWNYFLGFGYNFVWCGIEGNNFKQYIFVCYKRLNIVQQGNNLQKIALVLLLYYIYILYNMIVVILYT